MTDNLKVVYFLQHFPKADSQTFVLNEMAELVFKGIDVHVVAFTKEVARHSIIEKSGLNKKATYVYYKENKLWRFFLFLVTFLFEFIKHPLKTVSDFKKYKSTASNTNIAIHTFMAMRVLKRFTNYDVLHIPFPNIVYMEIAEAFFKETDIPFTATYRAREIYGKSYKQKYSSHCSQIITISEYNRTNLINSYVDFDAEVKIVHSSIDTSKFAPPINKPINNPPHIVCVGRYVEKKGIEYLLEACGVLASKGINFKLSVAGNGELQGKYEDIITKRNISNSVNLAGTLTQEEVKSLLDTADIFVLPCVIDHDGNRDILPNVLKEAMATEIATITTDIAGIAELIEHNVDGILVPEKTVVPLADAIESLLESTEKREQLGKAGREKIIRDFNVVNEAQKMVNIFSEVTTKTV